MGNHMQEEATEYRSHEQYLAVHHHLCSRLDSLVGFPLVDETQRSALSCAQISNFFPNFQMAKPHSGNFWACLTAEGAELSPLDD